MRIPRLRWLIAFALFLAAVMNYIDRSVLGVLASTIQKDLAISEDQYANVVSFFLTAYTIAYLLSGRIVDKLGVRLSLALFVAWWSVSNALTGLAQSARSLSVYRFMLGLGEAGVWTAAPKAVAEWFSPAERGVAVGLYSAGGAVGGAVAPVLVSLIVAHHSWRWVFAVSPVLALLWLSYWFWIYHSPARHPQLTENERTYLTANLEPASPITGPVESEASLWQSVVREPLVWQLMMARLLTDPVWYFYQFWLPKYLQTARGLDQNGLWVLSFVFIAADIGFIGGGLISGWFIKRGTRPPVARLRVLQLSACLTPLLAFVPVVATVKAVLFFTIIVACPLTFWLCSVTSLVVDVVPRSILGTAFGVIACGSTLGGIFMSKGVAWAINHHYYNECFYVMACVHPLALLLIWRLVKRYRPDDPAPGPMLQAAPAG